MYVGTYVYRYVCMYVCLSVCTIYNYNELQRTITNYLELTITILTSNIVLHTYEVYMVVLGLK
jgi:hypothetical protein